MDKPEEAEPGTLEELTMRAVMKAKAAFDAQLELFGYDPSFWDIKITAYMLDETLSVRLCKLEYEKELKGGGGVETV